MSDEGREKTISDDGERIEGIRVREGVQRLQIKEALMDENLPEEYRIELAKAFVNDLFNKVGKAEE